MRPIWLERNEEISSDLSLAVTWVGKSAQFDIISHFSHFSLLSPPPFDLTRPAKYLLIVCLPLLICKIYENKHFFHFVQCNTHSTLQNTTHQKQSNIRIYYDFQCSACMGFLSVRMSTLWLLGILLVVSFCMFLLSNTDVIIFFVFFSLFYFIFVLVYYPLEPCSFKR